MIRRSMHGDPVPDRDHVTRYCKPSTIDGGVLTVAAFRCVGDHLSVNWLEFFKVSSRDDEIECLRQSFRNKGYSLRRNGRFAVLGCGPAKERIRDITGVRIDVKHWPEEGDDSHAAIFGYGPDDMLVALELRNLAASDRLFPAVLVD